MTTYGPRVKVHPDRYGATKTTANRLLVVHTSEGSEGLTSAENLGSFMTLQGDRFNADGSRYGASYQYVTDTDRVLPATPDNVVAYAAAGANHDGIHICIPGKAAQTREQWLDTITGAYIQQLADVMRDKAAEYSIPLRRLTVAEVKAGVAGYCGHHDVSLAFGKSTHTDPGAAFPWDILAAELAPPAPPKESDMVRIRIDGYQDQMALVPIANLEQLAKMGFKDDSPLHVVTAKDAGALARDLGYPLTPL